MRPFGAPAVTDQYVMILTNSAPSTDGKHFRIYDKVSGVLKYSEKTSSGSYGGCVGLKDGRILVNTGQSSGRSYGTHIFFPEGNSWNKSTNEQNYAPNDQPNGSQIAIGADGKAYILCLNLGARISTNETKALVYCYDTKKTTKGQVSTPEWYTAVKGENKQTGYGLVVDGNGAVSYTHLDVYKRQSEGRYLDGKAQLRYTLNPAQIPDNIGWETSRTIDGGIDLGFWNNKITLSADYYVRKTVNMYTVGPTLPDTFGASSPKGNYADMSTYGYEISLGYNDSFRLAGKPFSFGIKATLADYHSVIDKYNNPKRDLDDYYVGQRIGEIWGFVCNGLFQSQDEIDAAFDGKGYKNNLMQTSVNYITYPGDMRFEDLNNTGTIDNGANTVDLSLIHIYLIIAVRNKCLNYLALKQQETEIRFSTIEQAGIQLQNIVSDNEHPLGNLLKEELESKIHESINKLPPACKQVFTCLLYTSILRFLL